MQRFMLLLGVAAIAGALYVASATGSLRTGPTMGQFVALKKQVGRLQTQVKTAENNAQASLGITALCIMHKPVGVDQVGTSTSGYLFGPPQTAPTAVTATASTALDLAPSTETSPQHQVYELNTSQPDCVTLAKLASTLNAKQSAAKLSAALVAASR